MQIFAEDQDAFCLIFAFFYQSIQFECIIAVWNIAMQPFAC